MSSAWKNIPLDITHPKKISGLAVHYQHIADPFPPKRFFFLSFFDIAYIFIVKMSPDSTFIIPYKSMLKNHPVVVLY